MPITITNKPQFTGIIILFTGVALLAFTFVNAFMFLQEPLGILASGDLARVFGEALAPLIQACVRLMYLGIMGWIGSLLTVRGIPLVTHKHVPAATPTMATQRKRQAKRIEQPEKAPTTSKQEEPRAVLIPPENQTEE